jgi:hypothetical protein
MPDVGVNLALSKALFVLLAVKYAAKGLFSINAIPQFPLLFLVFLFGIISGAITLSTETFGTEFAGGALRNGWFRLVAVTIDFSLSLLPIALVLSRGIPFSIQVLLKTYVVSVVILCVIGVVQYAIFRVTGADIIPLGMLQVQEENLRSGMGISVGGEIDLRPGSFAGEPKSLGMFAVTSLVLSFAFRDLLFPSRLHLVGVAILTVVTVFLTQSSSALIALPLALGIYFLLRFRGQPLKSGTVGLLYFGCASAILMMMMYRVANDVELSDGGVLNAEQYQTLTDMLYQRTIGRLSVEDFDWVILKAFLANPETWIFGRGFGLGHLNVTQYIPEANLFYMEGRVVFPKTGVTFLFVNGGVGMLALMMAYLTKLTPSANYLHFSALNSNTLATAIGRGQLALIPLVFLFLMRIYVIEVTMLIAAICFLGTRQAMGISPMSMRPAMSQRGAVTRTRL